MTGPGAGPRVDELERRYLNCTFAELCRIESPSGRERACAERVIAELRALEAETYEDGAAAATGSDCGNLLARIPGGRAGGPGEGGRRSLLLCAHLDTVPLLAPVEPELVDGFWENANEGVLGADNKAAVAVMLAVARHVHSRGAPVDLELLFTIGEETALAGARAFDATQLRSGFGYVFDHASPIGEVVVDSPTHFRIEVELRGAAAHAGIRPEQGRSAILAAARAIAAMALGRLDAETTANIGTIHGGSAANVIPDRCRVTGEARSIDGVRAQEVASAMAACLTDAANDPECECDLDVRLERDCDGYRVRPSAPEVALVSDALRELGVEPRLVASGGASDVNALRAKGCAVLNLGNGTERPHEPTESVSSEALEGMLEVALALVDRAA